MPDVYAKNERFGYSVDAVNLKYRPARRGRLPRVEIQVPAPWVGNLRALVRQETFGVEVRSTDGGVTTEAEEGLRAVRKPAASPIELRKENYDISVGRYRPMKKTLVLQK